jgi:hypothetical protein
MFFRFIAICDILLIHQQELWEAQGSSPDPNHRAGGATETGVAEHLQHTHKASIHTTQIWRDSLDSIILGVLQFSYSLQADTSILRREPQLRGTIIRVETP